jgi:23S rRNA (uracil1939-C5)-methyltransferase
MILSSSYEVTMSGLVYGGDAIGRLPDGRAVFVPFALPGEKVRLSTVEDKPRHVIARLEDVLIPSEERTDPRCRHFGVCGGCHYQHMPYDYQVVAKTVILVDQLKRIGKLANVPVLPMVASPDAWGYRNYVQFHLSQDGKLGYSKAHSNEIIAIEECFLPQPPLDELWRLLNFGPGTDIQRVGLRLGDELDFQITLESDSDTIPEFSDEELDASVVHLTDNSRVVLAGSEFTWFSVMGRLFRISAGTFFQVNTRVAEKMVEMVLLELPALRASMILEVYSGAGLFSAFLASRTEKLVAIETSGSACEDFMYNLDEFDNVELYEAPAEIAVPKLDLKPEIVLVDPPRNGLLRPVMQGLLKMCPQKIIYISCDPAILARDTNYLIGGGYELCRIRPFDMFPQTYHIESMSVWKRKP